MSSTTTEINAAAGEPALALPARSPPPNNWTPVWTVQPSEPLPRASREQQLSSILGDAGPLSEKCEVTERPGQPCCKDLKGEDERHLLSPEVVRDIIVGLSDGLTVPFALTAGLSSIGSSHLVVTAGLAELLAGALSMGLGGYLASQAEIDHYRYLRRQTRARVLRSCGGEMEREVHDILGPLGVKESRSRLITENLREVEEDLRRGSSSSVEARTTLRQRLNKLNRLKVCGRGAEEEGAKQESNDMGLAAFLLKFGEGMEDVPTSRLWISAITIGLSYFIGGLVPLVPYMANTTAQTGLIISACVTAAVLFVFGGVKTYFTGARGGWGGYLYGATSTMVVGGVAAGAAYGLVRVLESNGSSSF